MPPAPTCICAKCGYDLAGLGPGPCPECACTDRVDLSARQPTNYLKYLIPVASGVGLCLVSMAAVYSSESLDQMLLSVGAPLVSGVLNGMCGAIVCGYGIAGQPSRESVFGRQRAGRSIGAFLVGGVGFGLLTFFGTLAACSWVWENYRHGSYC